MGYAVLHYTVYKDYALQLSLSLRVLEDRPVFRSPSASTQLSGFRYGFFSLYCLTFLFCMHTQRPSLIPFYL